jgi:hypothetical protein
VLWPFAIARAAAPASFSLPEPFGMRVLEVLRAEEGLGEEGGNNAGPHVAKYKGVRAWKPKTDYGPWCASVISWAMMQCGFLPEDFDIDPKIWDRKRHGARALYKLVRRLGAPIPGPELGALVCWPRGRAGSWEGHDGVVMEVARDGVFWTREGNRGGAPARNDVFKHTVGEGELGFARFPSLPYHRLVELGLYSPATGLAPLPSP